jgi:hypothetical protein
MNPDFSAIPPTLHSLAQECWGNGDAFGLISLAAHYNRGRLLIANVKQLIRRGMYEEGLLSTYTHGPRFSPQQWRTLFEKADRNKLVSLGEPLPTEPITVYRGISDTKHRRWRRGLSWTLDPNVAAWFATRLGSHGNPAVFSLAVDPGSIFTITDERGEQEVVVAIWECARTKLEKTMPEPRDPS